MARARNIKPGFFANDLLAEVPPLGRLLWIGLWTIADREGRLEDRPKKIRAQVLPYDDCDVEEMLAALDHGGFITRYTVSGEGFIQVMNWLKHQDPHYKEAPSTIPPPEDHDPVSITPGGVPETTRQAVFDRDGRACKNCGSTEDLSLDHIVPRSKGGSHDEENLQTLCRRCNSAKNNRQARVSLDQSSANDRPTIGLSSPGLAPPDSPFLIPDSGFRIPDTGGTGGETETPPKSGKVPKAPRIPSWARAHNPTVVDLAQEIVSFWPDHKVDLQPVDPGKPPQHVPHTSAPLLAERLAVIVREGGDLAICKAISERAVREWRSEAKWIKAAQHFFGVQGPWKAYYQAHVTNQAQEEPSPPPRPKPRGNGSLQPLREVAP